MDILEIAAYVLLGIVGILLVLNIAILIYLLKNYGGLS